ncbi:hypothetical protein SLS62_008865 [Diatrype stigma]|uniref:Uncharacterized protein n=1 Tax=Diatrype stigma TaxID=117547 RepID=A0AAN9YM78_9PEZI
MPKRTLGKLMTGAMAVGDETSPPPKVQKTERSHEENQERAYIAASRRADRSLEARIQSAKMASEIHRRRTGRGLKVSEEIVLKEEMYEEEEDDLPRQYKYLTAHLQTNSPDMNSRVNAYITTQAAMATMARYNEINRLFSESFPTAQAYQQKLNQSMYVPPVTNMGQFSPPSQDRASNSPVQPSPISPTQISEQTRHDSIDRRPSVADSLVSNQSTISSPPALSPSSSTTPESRHTPYQTPVSAFPPSFQIDPQLTQQELPSSSSIFTSELPNGAKLMANIDMNDPMAMSFLGGDPSAWSMFGQMPGGGGKGLNEHVDKDISASQDDAPDFLSNDRDVPMFPSMEVPADRFEIPLESFSRVGTPGGGGGDAWDTFVDFGSEY